MSYRVTPGSPKKGAQGRLMVFNRSERALEAEIVPNVPARRVTRLAPAVPPGWSPHVCVIYRNFAFKSKEIDSGVPQWESPDDELNQPMDLPVLSAGKARYLKLKTDQYNQAIKTLPARCAIFVGNLPALCDDAELTQMLHSAFGRNALVFGYARRKVTYHQKGRRIEKPWAVMQFTHRIHLEWTLAHFDQAQNVGTYTFLGRTIRIERSRVPRDVYVSRVDGRRISDDEKAALLPSHYGPLEVCVYPPSDHLLACGLPLFGLYFRFQNYGNFLEFKEDFGPGGVRADRFRFVFGIFPV